jgi:hypothetical protein
MATGGEDSPSESRIDFRRIDYFERVLSLLCDAGAELPPPDLLRAVANTMRSRGFRPLQAQALRALGLAAGDAPALGDALGIFEEMAAAPYAARTRAELAILTDDRALLSSALQELAGFGDVQQQERYLASSGDGVTSRAPA